MATSGTVFKLEDAVFGNRVCNYSGMVAFTFTLYEWFSSLEEEVEQIWKRPWTGLKFLYLFLRGLPIITQLYPIVLILAPFTTSLGDHSVQTCRVVVGFQGAASQALMLGVQIVLLMRVDALYHQHIKLRLLLRAFYIAELVEMCLVFGLAMPQIKYGRSCLVTYFPAGFAAAFFLPPMFFDSILFILTMVKFYHAVREGWGREPVIYRFLKDGIWAFALPFSIVIINFMCAAFVPGPMSSIAYSWLIAIPAFAGCRLILNMSHLLGQRSSAASGSGGDAEGRGPSTYPDQDFMMTTRSEMWSRIDAGGDMATSTKVELLAE